MKAVAVSVCGLALVLTQAFALDPNNIPTHAGSAELQRMKSLQGSWAGTSEMDGVSQKIRVTYAVTAGGSVVMETLYPGTPQEMVSMYYDVGGKLNMVHYCMLGNQPHMTLKAAGSSHLSFQMEGSDGVGDLAETHMHALTITFIDDRTIEHEWTLYEDGDASSVTTFSLTRTGG